ncbi:MAG: SDR family oxidoreductase [Thermoleophilaceae bacterium]
MRALLAADEEQRIVALVEPRVIEQARIAAEEIDPQRIEVIEGDIGERNLGLDPRLLDRLRGEITVAYHLAAIYNLAVPLEIAQRVNVDGTGNVLDLCADCDRLERLNYVSTAYVAGERHGVVYEHELSLGQTFKNHYESTKFQAELWVRSALDRVPTTIYRPAIVVGDSRSGETQKFDGPYYMLRTISQSVARGAPIAQFGASSAPFNVVPVDFVIDAMLALSGDPAAVGETLHLVDPEPITARELLTLLSREYADRGPSLRIPPTVVASALRLPSVRALFSGAPRESIKYLNHPVRFDTRRASALLERHGLRCPRFDEYVGPIVSFFKEHEQDPAFAPAAT